MRQCSHVLDCLMRTMTIGSGQLVGSSYADLTQEEETSWHCRLLELRQNVFFGKVPKPKDPRQGPLRDQCHSEMAIKHAWHGFAHVGQLQHGGCGRPHPYDTSLLAYQARFLTLLTVH